MMPETTFCPHCMDGRIYRACQACGGLGEGPDRQDCAPCGGSGEICDPNPCATCGGTGEVSRVLNVLMCADRRIASQDPDWDGECRSHPGITQYSLASYYRKRERVRGRIASVRGVVTDGGDHRVVLFDADGEQLATFYGFCWGYGGEGPSGLMDVLQDALPHIFATHEQAYEFIVSTSMDRSWELGVSVAGGRS